MITFGWTMDMSESEQKQIQLSYGIFIYLPVVALKGTILILL